MKGISLTGKHLIEKHAHSYFNARLISYEIAYGRQYEECSEKLLQKENLLTEQKQHNGVLAAIIIKLVRVKKDWSKIQSLIDKACAHNNRNNRVNRAAIFCNINKLVHQVGGVGGVII